YHSLALHLTERSIAARVEVAGQEDIDFDSIIDEANSRLRGKEQVVGMEPDELRDRVLSGFEYVLVDEYQDIDARQYELITHIARRAGEDEDRDRCATILAVGDDDQSIYGWRDANIQFLRQFEKEFKAQRHYLVENYRSTQRIIAVSNTLICHNRDRMKLKHSIRVNVDRLKELPGGEWELLDNVAQGHVSLLKVEGGEAQTAAVLAEIERLRRLDPEPDWYNFAVLSRTHDQLASVRALLEREGVPVRRVLRDGLPPLWRIREFKRLLTHLEESKLPEVSIPKLRGELSRVCGVDSFWTAMASRMLMDIEVEFGEESCAVVDVVEALYRCFADHYRSHVFGDGVLVSTVHAAKGLEFSHVIVLGGEWKKGNIGSYEEERRLYYVAMTRARKTLALIDRRDDPLPYVREFESKNLRIRKVSVAKGRSDKLTHVRYTVLGMRDLFIDFAGEKPEGHGVHISLTRMQVGDSITLKREQSGQVVVLDCEGKQVGCLSKNTAESWQQPDLNQVDEVRVLGMVSREQEDCKPEYRDRIAVPDWELPLLEVRHRSPSTE
ncbi:MAG: ATP-dependent helicase, partial [Candidatus Dadabacteria bacterium]|nr:ATP-dependent helicase [Candidatus Dadabacteria bacterium]